MDGARKETSEGLFWPEQQYGISRPRARHGDVADASYGCVRRFKPTLDSLIELKVLRLLEHETGEAFLRAHQAVERIAQEKGLRQPRGYRDGN